MKKKKNTIIPSAILTVTNMNVIMDINWDIPVNLSAHVQR